MRTVPLLVLMFFLSLIPSAAEAESTRARFDDIRADLEASVSELGHVITRLETLQELMHLSAKANRNYDEQKNIFLSSMLAISTIIAVCQYEMDQLTLFLDLRAVNRQKYHGIRIESLETSLRQLGNMERQILINHSVFPSEFFEQPVFEIQQQALSDARAALKNCKDLLQSIQKK